MRSDHPLLPGNLVQYDRPDWRPLTSMLGEHLAESFMWMHELRLDDGTAVHAYKHIVTRRYLHLAPGGTAFAYLGDGGYAPLPLAVAVLRLIPPHAHLLADAADLEELRAVAQQLERP